jgi:hypothetical protein
VVTRLGVKKGEDAFLQRTLIIKPRRKDKGVDPNPQRQREIINESMCMFEDLSQEEDLQGPRHNKHQINK